MLRHCFNILCNKEYKPKTIRSLFCSIKCNQQARKFRTNKLYSFVCKNPNCNKKFKHKLQLVNYCSKYCKNLMNILNNPKRVKEYRQKYYIDNKNKINNFMRNHYKNNKAYYYANSGKRRAVKLLTNTKLVDMDKIKEIYKNCPKGYEVDHIVPLRGKTVCGLHVHWNLQYLTSKENRSKGNKLCHS